MSFAAEHEDQKCNCDRCQDVHWDRQDTGPVPEWAKGLPQKIALSVTLNLQKFVLGAMLDRSDARRFGA